MLSAHTSPMDQPGTGDAGGMNVYIRELAGRLVSRGIEVDIFTRATSSRQPVVVDVEDGLRVLHVAAGPFEELTKQDLPAQLCAFVRDVLRADVAYGGVAYDIVHSHYWLSGQVGTVTRDRWATPLVHTMHTMAKVKNASLAAGDQAEPLGRILGEEEIVRLADRLIANTAEEAHELQHFYAADPDRVRIVHPGVDLTTFAEGDQAEARAALGIDPAAALVVFAGRIQPLKAPDVVIRAGRILADHPDLAGRLAIGVIGGPSGSDVDYPAHLRESAAPLGDAVRFVPTVSQTDLARWYAAADVVCVPSHNESFGLVALEAQACGTPVVAARVGGLTTAVADGVTGTLVDGHEPGAYAAALAEVLLDGPGRATMRQKAVTHAAAFGWDATAEATLDVYAEAKEEFR